MKDFTMIKTCLNDDCDKKNVIGKYKVTDKYCVKCGGPLVHVCKQCGVPIENDRQEICDDCVARIDSLKEQRKQVIVDAGKAALGFLPTAISLAASLMKPGSPIAKQVKKVDKVINK